MFKPGDKVFMYKYPENKKHFKKSYTIQFFIGENFVVKEFTSAIFFYEAFVLDTKINRLLYA